MSQATEQLRRHRWDSIHDSGWSTLFLPRADGGASGTVEDLATIATLLGEQLFETSLISHAMAQLALSLTSEHGRARTGAVQDALDGALLTPVLCPPPPVPGRADGAGVVLRRGGLHGRATLVADATDADLFVVFAPEEAGPRTGAHVVPAWHPGLDVRPDRTDDVTRSYCTVIFDGVPVGPAQTLGPGAVPHARANTLLLELAAILVGCDAMGGSRRCLRRAGPGLAPDLPGRMADARTALDRAVRLAHESMCHPPACGDRALGTLRAARATATAATTSSYLALAEHPAPARPDDHRHLHRARLDQLLAGSGR